MTEELTSIELGVSQANRYKIHPSVVISILDAYHRNTTRDFIIGILLGTIYPDFVSVTNVMLIPFEKKDGESSIQTDTMNKLLEYNSKIYHDTKVGWFITKSEIDIFVGGFHNFFSKILKSSTTNWSGPLILLVDPTLKKKEEIDLKGYTFIHNRVFKDEFAAFQPVEVDIEVMEEKFSSSTNI